MKFSIFTALFVGIHARLDGRPDSRRIAIECVSNVAAGYPCEEVDFEGFLPTASMNSDKKLNDIWGWTDPDTKKEYAIVGKEDGTAFVDVSDPGAPRYLGFLEGPGGKSGGDRDIKTYKNYAYIVADVDDHGLQIFDLTWLRNVNFPVQFVSTSTFNYRRTPTSEINNFGPFREIREDDNYDDYYGYAYNIAINEDTGYAYLVGSNNCDGGLYMINLEPNPLAPTEAGCYGGVEWIYDAQCVTYHGPDVAYTDSEICFVGVYETDGLAVIDVTNKSNPQLLSQLEENYFKDIEQGWLTEDHSFFILGEKFGEKTNVLSIDVRNLNAIGVSNTFTAPYDAQTGNVFVNGEFVYFANFKAGLRIFELPRSAGTDNAPGSTNGNLVEVGYFDTYQKDDKSGNEGVRGVYPFFDSGIIIFSDVKEGLFIVSQASTTRRPTRAPIPQPTPAPTVSHNPTKSSSPSSKPSKSRMPSSSPIVRPTRSPTQRPTERDCNFNIIININGRINSILNRFTAF